MAARIYKNFDVWVNLGQLHPIRIFITGQARYPGSYAVSSLSTLVSAIFATGGPAPQGSMRHILLRRNGTTIADFDMYDLLVNGDKSHDVELLPGDVVYIPPVGPQVAVYGSVRSPAIYELKDQKETSYRRPLYLNREPKKLEAGARMPNGRTVDSTAKRQLISSRT